MKLSVVVPAFNEERLLAGSLAAIRDALRAFEEADWATELIVCDNNSTDRTAEIARDAGAAVVFEPVNQIARARNAGAAHATGEWLLFVDADSYPDRDLMNEVLQEIRGGRCLAGGATVAFETDDALARWWIAAWNFASRHARWAAGSFVFCDSAAFRELGGFSQKLYAAEELDFFGRLKRHARTRGREIVILHRHPLRTSGRKAKLYTKREFFWFLLKTALLGGRTLRSRASCYAWYDGRR
ncbi:MAG TPA: glycosyltransferase [Burkholderiales bacterium]|nr:glycosyltransferase [Burkholderiales bacterium]